jgi:hypothetical protein
VTPTVAAATAAMISGFLLSMSISCNSEFLAADYGTAALSLRDVDDSPTFDAHH